MIKQYSFSQWGLLTILLISFPGSMQGQSKQSQGNVIPKLPSSQNIDLRQEIEIDYRIQIIHATQKAINCIKNTKTIDAIDVCKREESHELNVIKNYKKEREALLLRR